MSDTEPSRAFEIYGVGETFRCDLVLGDGTLILRSDPLTSVADAVALVDAMRGADAALCPRMTADGEFYFTLERARKVLATSPLDRFPADRDRRIELARAASTTAALVFVDHPTAGPINDARST